MENTSFLHLQDVECPSHWANVEIFEMFSYDVSFTREYKLVIFLVDHCLLKSH